MSLLLLGLTIGTVGKLIVGIAVMRVHIGILKEHKIDNAVLGAIKREQYLTLCGLVLIVIGYFLEVAFYAGYTTFFDCAGGECAAAIQAAFSQ